MSKIDQSLLDQFAEIVGPANALVSEADKASYLEEARKIYQSRSPLVLRPGSVKEVSEILKLASITGTPIVPQAGNTGHVGGAVANPDQDQIILSVSRLNQIRDVDPFGNTMIVEAGVILESVHRAATDHDRLFPLSIGAKGTCQIGGNLSTNAGGTAVLAYGNMRDLVLGLEVVLPNGDIWDGLRRLKKDNTGYNLRNLFVGAEGTLGIVTAAVLKLFPIPKGKEVAFIGLRSPEDALELLTRAGAAAGNDLTGFELMPRVCIDVVARHIPGQRDPMESQHPWYVLMEISSSRAQEDARDAMETVLGEAFEDDLVQDAVIAQSAQQQDQFWALRESISPAQKPEGGSIKHDVSVPVSAVPDFLRRAGEIIETITPGGRVLGFGHMGDGNIHYNISEPEGGDPGFLDKRLETNAAIHALVRELDGSISAEHGIGLMKRDEMARTKQPVEMEMMRAIKRSFDPNNIMNPGKVVEI
ncbi:MAG: FAD-binding oxidoreductase [Pseudomonadota bacterium]